MSRRKSDPSEALSLDSFLDIVTNVVGVLILVAVVTVLSAGDITMATGATALRPPPKAAKTRVLLQCARDKVFVIDEEGNAEAVRAAAAGWATDDVPLSSELVVARLDHNDIGDRNHRIRAEQFGEDLAWTYELRARARGDDEEDLRSGDSKLERLLRDVSPDSYVYFVVEEGSFDVFREARELVRARGLATGWHPVERDAPLRISKAGSLGQRVQ